MRETPPNLAMAFAQEVYRRKRDRTLQGMKLWAMGLVVLMVAASFIPEPQARRWTGLVLVGLLLGIKGYLSYQHWRSPSR